MPLPEEVRIGEARHVSPLGEIRMELIRIEMHATCHQGEGSLHLRHHRNAKQPLKLLHFPSPPSDGCNLFPGSHFQCSAAAPGQDLLCRKHPSTSTSFQKHRPECGALDPPWQRSTSPPRHLCWDDNSSGLDGIASLCAFLSGNNL